MSTVSNDLDQSLFGPVAEFENKSTSNVSLQWNPCLDDTEYDDKAFAENTLKGTEEESKTECQRDSEKGDETDSLIWFDKEFPYTRSADSWDLPLGPIAWDENDKPIERLLTYADLTLTDEEENGLLTDRIVAACSSYLTQSPGNKCHVVAKVSLNNKNLNDIRILGYHRFLQYVDLSWNNLTDLTPLGCLPYLMYLDVSHNLLEEVLRFRPPLNLTYVNYSYNEVWQIDDLTDFWALSYLDLSHNKISKIQGLHYLRYLRHLDLSHNKIEKLENLDYLRITDLNLEYNLVSRFETQQNLGMCTLRQLKNVYLNNNLVTSLDFLKGVHTLKKLELQNNNITELVELSHLKKLKSLRHLDLSGNLVSELKPYRSLVLNYLQELKFLDQTEVDISERVASCKSNKFDIQLEAARNNARMILLEQLNDTSLDLDVLPVDQGPYPFVILVGPSASSKKYIVSILGEKYPNKVLSSAENIVREFRREDLNPQFTETLLKIYIGKLHTTREILEPEKSVLVHLNKEDFNEYVKGGKFLCVSENLGDLYGFSREELGMAIKEHKLCLTTMDMVGALTVHSYGIQPFLVLAIPKSKEDHTEKLKKTYSPVLSVLGATYIAQRQRLETHASNVERVELILDDFIHDILKTLPESEALLQENTEVPFKTIESAVGVAGQPSRALKVPSSVLPSEKRSEQGSSRENCYASEKGCFACTSSKCGYQTSKLAKEETSECSTSADDSIRLSTPETDCSSQDTSYSATTANPIKIISSPLDEESYGEDNPFVNWDMPFIDWSEVNITNMELEEAAKILCDKYIENVMSSREVYQNLHLENPGLFSLSVFTDDTNKAVKEITKFLKEVWRSTPKRMPIFDVENDLVYKAYIPRKLDQLKEILRNDFISADGDSTFKGLNNVAPINSPVSICAEMHMKGYGDFAENL